MKDFVLMDGGFETELKKYVGSGFDGHPLWVSRYLIENPEACRKAAQNYIQSGAEMILANTYQATVDGFHKHMGLSKEQSLDLMKLAVDICKQAVELEKEKGNTRPVSVVGMLGPYGAFLHNGSEYAGGNYADQMTTEELVEWHRSRFEALVEAGSDCLIFTTIPSIKEAEALILLLKEQPEMKAIISFSAQNEETISHGEKLSDAAQHCWELASDQILAIGVNCQHPRYSEPLLRSIKERNPQIPLMIRPNTNEVFNTESKEWEVADNSKTLPDYCKSWLNLGVKYIGGCCRTSTQDIRDFREEINKFCNKTN